MTRIAVVVASLNRPEEIAQLLRRLDGQTLRPCLTVLSVESEADLPAGSAPDVTVVMGRRGLTAQRNRGLDMVLGQCEIVVFFDDDFVPVKTALADIAALFDSYPDIIAATGLVLRDGVKRGGLSYGEALDVVAQHEAGPPKVISNVDADAVYGCNMAFRAGAIGALRFDERLPLYAWQEDVDFAGQLRPRGRVVRTTAFAGVHRGVSKGRGSGVALGFSQVVNPIYLTRKGTMRRRKALLLIAKNILANHLKLLTPESFIDRRGRALGNWRGLSHLLRGRLDPGAILKPPPSGAAR